MASLAILVTKPGPEYLKGCKRGPDGLIVSDPDLRRLADSIREISRNNRRLKRRLRQSPETSTGSHLVHTLKEHLSQYTTNVASHVKGLSLRQRWDRVIAMSEEQYYLYMVEVELVNRVNVEVFRTSSTRLAFLPHCIHNLTVRCQSIHRGEDHVCKGWPNACVLNAVSKLLRRHGVTPYIWMTANLQSLFRRLHGEGKTVGVLGIACIPELVRGMRQCMRAGVPGGGENSIRTA